MALGPIVERIAIAPANGIASSALEADVLRVELLEAEFEAVRLDASDRLLLPGGLGDLLLGSLALGFHDGLLEPLRRVPGWPVLPDLPLHLYELGMRNSLVRGEQRWVEGLGCILSGEVPRLRGRPEDLLHRVGMDVQLIDGLERLVLLVGVEARRGDHS